MMLALGVKFLKLAGDVLDGVGLDGRVQLACAELHGERDAAVLEGQVHVVVPVACEGFLSFICNSK